MDLMIGFFGALAVFFFVTCLFYQMDKKSKARKIVFYRYGCLPIDSIRMKQDRGEMLDVVFIPVSVKEEDAPIGSHIEILEVQR